MNGTLLSCQIAGIRTLKDGTVSLTIETQEISPGKAGELFALRNKLAAVYISPKDNVDQREIDQVDKLDPELQGKSQSQRIRAVLWRCFEKNPDVFKDFDSFYKSKTELYIDHLKKQLD